MARARRVIPRPRAGMPTYAEVIREAISSRLLEVHSALPGKVLKYYPRTATKQATVDVQPMIRQATPASDGSTVLETLPVLMDLPIGWMQTGAASLQLKLVEGDTGNLIFSEAAMAQWRATGALSEPGDLRRHDLSYASFSPCLVPDGKPLPALASGESVVLDADGVIRMGGPSADFVALNGNLQAYITQLENDLVTAFTAIGAGLSANGALAATSFGTTTAAARATKAAAIPAAKLKGE